MMKLLNTRFCLLVFTLLVLFVFSACSNNDTPNNDANTENNVEDINGDNTSNDEELEHVELVWHFPLPQIPQDIDKIEEAVNQITEEKINATIKLKAQSFGDYPEKMNFVAASGEKTDIIWTSNWSFNYVQNQAQGVFISLDELLEEYASEVLDNIPDFVWDATRIEGKIYGIPNYQTVTNREGFRIVKSIAEKYDVDLDSVKDPFEDIEPILQTIKENESDLFPLVTGGKGIFESLYRSLEIEGINEFGTIRLDEPTEVFNVYESPEYKKYLDLIHNWYEKGLINEDAPTKDDINEYLSAGRVATGYHHVSEPGAEAKAKNQYGGQDILIKHLTDPYTSTASGITTLQAISRTSENPERAMMFINLVNTDKELYNILAHGIEDVHYKKIEENVIEPIADSGYAPNSHWVFGNIFNAYLTPDQDAETVEAVREENENAIPSPIIGFKFDPNPVTTQIANITTVIDQYQPGLNSGALNPDESLDEFLKALDNAGMDTVIEEMQNQLDEWYKTK